MDRRYTVTLTRDGKTIHIVLRADDYTNSVRIDRANNVRMKYGSGKMWDVTEVKPFNQEAL